MVVIAAALYLPEHVATISRRAFYYYSGLPPRDPVANPAAVLAATGKLAPDVELADPVLTAETLLAAARIAPPEAHGLDV